MCLSVCQFICMLVCPSVHLCFYLFIFISYPSVRLDMSKSPVHVNQSICLLNVCLRLSLFIFTFLRIIYFLLIESSWSGLECPGEYCYWLIVSHATRSFIASYFVLEAVREAKFLGRTMFVENMVCSGNILFYKKQWFQLLCLFFTADYPK